MMKIVNQTVPLALAQARLHRRADRGRSSSYIDENETIEGAPHLKDEHLPVFDCAFKPAQGQALDPLHGPHQDDGRRAAVPLRRDLARPSTCRRRRPSRRSSRPTSRRGGSALKAVAIYRDGSKRTQPLNTVEGRKAQAEAAAPAAEAVPQPRPPQAARRAAVDHAQVRHRRATRATSPSACTRTARRARSSSRWPRKARRSPGFADAFAQAISLRAAVRRAAAGAGGQVQPRALRAVGHDARTPTIRFAKSIIDYIFRWLATKFLSPEAQFRAGVNGRETPTATPSSGSSTLARRSRRRGGRGAARRRRRADVAVRGDPEPGRRAAVLDVRVDHGAQRRLLQVHQLRHDERLRVGKGRRQ